MAAEADKSCPQCHSAAVVTKASALYHDCIYAASKKEWLPANWESWSRYQMVPTEAKARKDLAKKLAPPQNYWGSQETGGGVVGMLEGGEVVIIGVILVAIVGAFVLLVKGLFGLSRKLLGKPDAEDSETMQAKEQTAPTPAALSPWQVAMNCWDSLYYCTHCDGVFTPGQGVLVPSKQMHSLLYR